MLEMFESFFSSGKHSKEAQRQAEALYRQATALRKTNRHHEAVPLYLSALACYGKLDQQEYMSTCLNGLGISYKELTKEVLKRELMPLTKAPPSAGSLATYIYQVYQKEVISMLQMREND